MFMFKLALLVPCVATILQYLSNQRSRCAQKIKYYVCIIQTWYSPSVALAIYMLAETLALETHSRVTHMGLNFWLTKLYSAKCE